MAESRQPRTLDHEYDGIREYDNPTPGWWHLIFAGTILFSVVYVFVAHFSPMYKSPSQRVDIAQRQEFERMFAGIGTLEPDERTLLTMMREDRWQRLGAALFKTNCVSCHGPDGGGLVGPNLTDDFWKNVDRVEDVYTVIAEGAANGAIPAWAGRLHGNELVLLSSYVASMRGNTPSSARAPEGEAIAPWPEVSTGEAPSPGAGGGA